MLILCRDAVNPQSGQVIVPVMGKGVEVFKLTASNPSTSNPTYTGVPYTSVAVVGRKFRICSLATFLAVAIWVVLSVT